MRASRFAVPFAAGLAVAVLSPGVAGAKMLHGSFEVGAETELVRLRHGDEESIVRIFGVDAPEVGEPFAREAQALVRDLVAGRDGAIRFRVYDERRHMVSKVFAGGEDVALALLRAGLARRLPEARYKPTAEGVADALTAAELEARAAGRGIWSLVPPEGEGGETAREAAVAEELEPLGVEGTIDLNTSKKTGNDPECAIAKNPVNPNQLFVACNTDSSGLFAARSTDGGASWIYPDPADKTIADGDAGQGDSACCDPTLAWDSFGNLFVTYLGGPGVATLLSTDGGATFSELLSFGGGTDQPTVVTANTTGGSVVWIVYNTGSMVARGAAVTGLGAVDPWSGVQTAPGTSGCSFGDIAVAPNGKVVQACGEISPLEGNNNDILVNTDPDGLGASGFGAAVVATTTNVGGFDTIPAQNNRSVDAEAGLAYDRNPASPHFGRLYLMYNDEPINESHDFDVMVRWSDDDGATWSSAVKVNDDATTRSQFLPKIASDPATGALAVCWHDCRNDPTNEAMELFCAHSVPGGPAPIFTASVAVSDGASVSNGQGVEFGDYAGLTYVDGLAHPVWADISNSTGDNPNGTTKFDAYADLSSGALFADGFETGDTGAWSQTVP